MNLLIIEDDEDLSNLLKRILAKHSIKASQAFDFDDAIGALRDKYDVIISDIDLGGKRKAGPKALLQSNLHGARVIFTTATADYQESINQIAEIGYRVDLVKKPLYAKEILELLTK